MADGSVRDVAEPEPDAPPGLVWSSDETPGLSRRRAGKGFSYRDERGRPIRDMAVLNRIRSLAIPPAWTEVWICPDARGHIQATGRDARGRKQYRYHPGWTQAASETKFDRLAQFARRLPRLRRRIEADLALRGPTRDKVLATAVRLLELSLIRIGNARYARANRSFGLTTLYKRHLEVDGAALVLAFRGKSGIDHRVSVRDRRLARVVRSLRDLPGQRLFQYRNAEGELVPVTSEAVNAYIRDAMGEAFSAKDFRTWAGTVSAARVLVEMPAPQSATEARRAITRCCRAVAGLLGNTPTVCRASYVHPRVLDAFEAGELAQHLPSPEAASFDRRLLALLEAQG